MFKAIKVLVLAVLACVIPSLECAEINKPCPDPMSCICPTSPNPACAPWPTDMPAPDGGTR